MSDNPLLANVLFKQMSNALNNFILQYAFLDLWELKNDWNKAGKIPLCIDTYRFTVLKTVECDVNNILVQ